MTPPRCGSLVPTPQPGSERPTASRSAVTRSELLCPHGKGSGSLTSVLPSRGRSNKRLRS